MSKAGHGYAFIVSIYCYINDVFGTIRDNNAGYTCIDPTRERSNWLKIIYITLNQLLFKEFPEGLMSKKANFLSSTELGSLHPREGYGQ